MKKNIIIAIASLLIGYFVNPVINTSYVKLEQSRSGMFVIKSGRIFRLYEISNNEPNFVESLKSEHVK